MNARIRLAVVTLGFVMLIVSAADAQPRWQLKVDVGEPGVVAVFDVLNHGTNYWYYPITVTNKTEKPIDTMISVKAFTDTKKTYLSGYYPEALTKVQRLLGKKVEGAWKMRGVLKPGESWTAVALFKSVDTSMDRITFQIQGIEDVIECIKGICYVEIRALQFCYKQLGDEYFPWEDPIEFVNRKWKVLKQRTRVPRG